MMHGHEKSRSAIVAVKPTNKAERSAAESVERRAETKGNVDQQRTHRTQCRARVVSALASIRPAAMLDCQYPRWEPYAANRRGVPLPEPEQVQQTEQAVAVGTRVTSRPPHRPVLAAFPLRRDRIPMGRGSIRSAAGATAPTPTLTRCLHHCYAGHSTLRTATDPNHFRLPSARLTHA
jgi:hypothetical protein